MLVPEYRFCFINNFRANYIFLSKKYFVKKIKTTIKDIYIFNELKLRYFSILLYFFKCINQFFLFLSLF